MFRPVPEERCSNLGIVYASDLMKRQKTTSDWASEKAEGLFVQSLHNFFGFFGQCAQGAQGFVTKMSESMTAMRQNAPGPPFNCTESKFKAMSVEADNFYSQYQNQTWKNIISASAESISAAAILLLRFHRCCYFDLDHVYFTCLFSFTFLNQIIQTRDNIWSHWVYYHWFPFHTSSFSDTFETFPNVPPSRIPWILDGLLQALVIWHTNTMQWRRFQPPVLHHNHERGFVRSQWCCYPLRLCMAWLFNFAYGAKCFQQLLALMETLILISATILHLSRSLQELYSYQCWPNCKFRWLIFNPWPIGPMTTTRISRMRSLRMSCWINFQSCCMRQFNARPRRLFTKSVNSLHCITKVSQCV